jgi:hypothetical protein
VQAGLPAARAEDFVIAVSEIAANAVRYGSAARLLLRVAGGTARGNPPLRPAPPTPASSLTPGRPRNKPAGSPSSKGGDRAW